MSQRPRPGAARAAQNQQVIKDLLKLNCNKTCADCKRNKHGPVGISASSSVYVALGSIEAWGRIYWEAKLPPGHVPSEAKIENFIRTKYESKRWVMDGPMPDPSTLDGEADDDVLSFKKKAKLERSASHRTSTVTRPSTQAQSQSINLFDDNTPTPPTRPKTTDIAGAQAPVKSSQPPAASKQNKPADSLLGLDFFGTSQTPTASRPSSTPSGPTTTGPSRPDLKQSILSLYASAPKAQPAPQHDRTTSFGSSVSFQTQPKPPNEGPETTRFVPGRSFDLIDATMGSKKSAAAPPTTSTNDMLDLFSSPPPTTSPPVSSPPNTNDFNSAFNLSAPKPHATKQTPPTNTATTTSMFSSVNIDPWGGNAWTSTDPSPPVTQSASIMKVPDTLTANDIGRGWGAPSDVGGTSAPKPAPTITGDEDFGGWTSAMPSETTTSAPKSKSAGGFAGNDDLFSNVWE
ncbi:hypothetical protein UREG_01185 [Uncinocarpus reesii 1704]|uniref:Arf-GAP domain-containing protein n=1 Tax=Uncinocarpus reesii (strain UAMH 1704) TaxID=336963 RepID=C4JGJ4_UNCRE|nr:uncharacterized protein UREG_01185 [Uncinocarpus reesii 1704]EEP76336.1 hypothetical protein UREG_01185 [Uncinocarpus reesii 1704]